MPFPREPRKVDGQMLLSSTGLRHHQPHLFLVWKSKSGQWEIPLRRFGGHHHKFKLSNSNSIHGGCLKPTTATKAQRQEDVYPHHMWLWTCCPFKELGGRLRTASCRGSVKRYGFLSVLWRMYGSTVCPSPPIRPLPLLPFLRRSWLLSLRPLPKLMVTVLSLSQSPTVFFFGACNDGLPKLAVWPGLSFASQ